MCHSCAREREKKERRYPSQWKIPGAKVIRLNTQCCCRCRNRTRFIFRAVGSCLAVADGWKRFFFLCFLFFFLFYDSIWLCSAQKAILIESSAHTNAIERTMKSKHAPCQTCTAYGTEETKKESKKRKFATRGQEEGEREKNGKW